MIDAQAPMSIPLRILAKLVITPGLLVGLPIVGLLLSGNPLDPYLEFPPTTYHVLHAPFSWPVFAFTGGIDLILIGGLLFIALPGKIQADSPERNLNRHGFPWWGWLGLLLLVSSWTLAWSRFSWFAELQTLTFTPLWLSFLLIVNALTYRRVGHCLLLNRPGFFLSLFFLSALFWWYFEYLNRFVQSWHYIGIEDFTPTGYFLHSSIAFSTVLPAVLSTCEWFQTFPQARTSRFPRPFALPYPCQISLMVLAVASCSLFGIALWPDYLYPLLWVAPLLIMVSLQVLLGEETLLTGVARGHWQVITVPAFAALLCGIFWEMWNYYSAAKWGYSIPFVQRFEIFEMPILGYAGYLPFGLECVVAVDFVSRLWDPRKPSSPFLLDKSSSSIP